MTLRNPFRPVTANLPTSITPEPAPLTTTLRALAGATTPDNAWVERALYAMQHDDTALDAMIAEAAAALLHLVEWREFAAQAVKAMVDVRWRG